MNTALRLMLVILAAVSVRLSAAATALRIEQTIEPRFPTALLLSTITDGEARVVIHVDATGQLVDWLVTGYSDKAFADEAVTVLKAWRYEPPAENGRPTGVRTELRFQFASRGRVVSLTAIETPDMLLKQMGLPPTLVWNVCTPQELDRPLAAVDIASPLYPAPSLRAPANQSVVVDFYVDEKGQPRMPVVVNGAQVHYASSALDALSRWRFTAPKRDGRPVLVRVRQEFIFPGRS